jgi:PhnB protein
MASFFDTVNVCMASRNRQLGSAAGSSISSSRVGGRMPTTLNPYLNFRSKARDAMSFYQTVFGGKLDMQTFKDFHASQDPADDEKIMHAQLVTDHGLTLMAADTPKRMNYRRGTNFSISLSGDNEAELRGYFEKLAAGGTVTMPLEKAQWGDTFGMCTDKFGISWLVNIAGSAAR